MEFINHIYAYLVFASCLSILSISVYLFLVYNTQVARSFAQVLFVVAIWLAGSGFSAISTNEFWAEFWWYQVRFSMIIIISFFLLKFVLQYTNNYEKLKKYHMLFLALPQIIFLFINLTNSHHGLIATNILFVQESNIYLRINWTPGPVYWMHSTVTVLYNVVSIVLLLKYMLNSNGLQKTQTAFILFSLIFPAFVGLPQSLFRINWGLDFLGLMVAATCITNAIAIFRYRLFSITPIARNMLIEGMQDLVIVTDTSKNVIDLNRAAQMILDDPSNVLGKPVKNIFPQLRLGDFLSDSNLNKTAQIMVNGIHESYDINITPIHLQKNQLLGHLIVMRNISELQSLISDLDAYAHTVAHDLKNPVNTLRWYIELSQKAIETNNMKDVGLFLSSMSKLSGHMNQIIDEILLFAGLRSIDEKDLTKLDMNAIIENIKNRLSGLINDKGAQIVCGSDWPEIISFSQWIEEVLANYVSYAIKYGGIPPIIEVTAEKTNENEIKFIVKDNGNSTSEIQEIINTDAENNHSYLPDGRAFTLSIVKRIIKKLNGKTGVENIPGKGTAFYFILPTIS